MNIYVVILMVLGVLISFILTRVFLSKLREKGFVGVDVFKLDRPKIPTLGGIPLLFSYIIMLSLFYFFGFIPVDIYAVVVLVSFLSAYIGLLDDLLDLPGYFKPVACLICGLPIILFGTYVPRLSFPLDVGFRITYIYILLILLGISVSANTVNMFDVINGSALVGTLITLVTIIISAWVLHPDFNLYPALILLVVLLGFLPFNIYPSRIFIGNVGSLLMGSQLALYGILYKVEFQAVVAMLPFIHNSFFFLNKFKKFIEHKRLGYKVTFLDEGGLICDAGDPSAPITLIRFLVASEPMSEKNLLVNIIILFGFSSFLALLSFFWW